jgi:cell wall-associated NlpC family hydrolase
VPASRVHPVGTLLGVVADKLRHAVRGAVALSAVTVAVSLNPAAATADPTPPANEQDAQKQVEQQTQQADQIGQQYLAAKDDLAAKQADLANATADIDKYGKQLTDAKAKEEQFRGQVDQVAAAAFDGAQFTQLSALLTGKSAQDFLDQSSALQLLAQQNSSVLDTYEGAIKSATDAKAKATAAQTKAKDASDAAQKILADLQTKKDAATKAVNDAKAAVAKLSSAAKQTLGAAGNMGTFIGPAGAAGTAMQAALSQRGVPYQWGGETPGDGFDCSGLMQWAWGQAGISLPRSAAAQFGPGKSVSRSDLQAGDVVFFGTSASNIYHVGMMVSPTEFVHAPAQNQVVKVQSLSVMSDYFGAKRYVG